jgi:hypothetical protein
MTLHFSQQHFGVSYYLSLTKKHFAAIVNSLFTKVATYRFSIRACRSTVLKSGSFLIFFIGCNYVFAQSFAEATTKKGTNAFTKGFFGIYARYTHLNGKYTEPFGGITANLFLKKNRLQKWQRRYRFEHPLIGDFLYVIAKDGSALLNDQLPAANATEQNFSSGWLGWHKTYWNIHASNKKIISVGISYGDYIFGSKRIATPGMSRVQEPAGYYFYAGPAVLGSFMLTKKIWLDAYANVDINFTKAAKPSSGYQEIKGYPLPKHIVIGADIYTTSKLYGGIRYNTMLDNGLNKDRATRIDINLGMFFTL